MSMITIRPFITMEPDWLRHTVFFALGLIAQASLLSAAQVEDGIIAIVNSGEETGKLPESLERLADDYEEQVSYMVRNLGQLVQPLLLIMLGGIVLFIILAVLLPYIQVLTSLSGGGS